MKPEWVRLWDAQPVRALKAMRALRSRNFRSEYRTAMVRILSRPTYDLTWGANGHERV